MTSGTLPRTGAGAGISAPARFREALARLGSAQKSGAGVPAYMRWVNRRLGRYLAAAAYALGLTPNAVTGLSAAASLAGLVVVAVVPATAGAGVLAAALLATGFALDSADGQLARLTGAGSRAGEWLDHVVDAVRAPALHLAVLIGLTRSLDAGALDGLGAWPLAVALAFAVLVVGQFMSQVLAEQLAGRVHREQGGSGTVKSLALLPTDTGVFCWMFLLWGAPVVFALVYAALFVVNFAHTAVSMRRKYVHLVHIGRNAA